MKTVDSEPAEMERAGDWGCTSSGRRYYPRDPRSGDFDIEDIAHALSLQCRFGGHVRRHYSVAEHCVHVSYECCAKYALDGLLHDASEAYLVDVPRPAKSGLEGYARMESRIMSALIPQLRKLPRRHPDNVWQMPACVVVADERMLATEARDLMPQHEHGDGGGEAFYATSLPYPHLSVKRPWSHAKAKRRFLRRYRELTWNLTPWDEFVIAVRRFLGKDGCR